MSPLSLLFSSDQETSRRLLLALHDLGLEVELCPDIFTALERLTTGEFEIILADCEEGAEAAFLLKTARDSAQEVKPFTIVLAKAVEDAFDLGADLVLLRPFSPQSLKHAFASCDEFLVRYESCFPGLARTNKGQHSRESNANRTAQSPQEAGSHLPASLEPLPFLSAYPAGERASDIPARSRSSAARRESLGQFLRWSARVAVIIVLGSAGYLASQTTRSAALVHPVAAMYHHAMGKIHIWVVAHEDEDDDSPPSRSTHIEARGAEIPANDMKTSPRATVVSPPPTPEPGYRELSANLQAAIPASLREPTILPPGPPVMSPRISPAAPGAAEPVTITEDLSQALIVERVAPAYPANALQSGLEGSVVLQAHISKDGNVNDVKLVRGPLPLVNAACAAVKQWRYKPYVLDGQAMEAQTYVTLNFKRP